MLEADTSAVTRLQGLTKRFRKAMNGAGFDLGGNDAHPIVPVMIYDAALASRMADALLERGIYVIGFSFPVSEEVTCTKLLPILLCHEHPSSHR